MAQNLFIMGALKQLSQRLLTSLGHCCYGIAPSLIPADSPELYLLIRNIAATEIYDGFQG